MRRCPQLPMKAIAAVVAVSAALGGGDAETAFAAGGPTRSTDSLTTQFPLGDQKLARPGPGATSPNASATSSSTTSATPTASALPGRTTTSSRDPLLGSGGHWTDAVILIGALAVGGLALALVLRLSIRRRRPPGLVVDDPAIGARPDGAAAVTTTESRQQGIERLRRAGTPSTPPPWRRKGKGNRPRRPSSE